MALFRYSARKTGIRNSGSRYAPFSVFGASQKRTPKSAATENRTPVLTPCLTWQNGHTAEEMQPENLLQMTIPVKGAQLGDAQYFKIDIVTNGSLESAGRRAALFARLADENRFDSPTPDHQEA